MTRTFGMGRAVSGRRTSLADRVIGTTFFIAAVVAIIAARGTVVMLPLVFVMAVAFTAIERNPLNGFLRPAPAAIPLALFLTLAAASAGWSADAAATLDCTTTAALVLVQWHVVDRWLAVQETIRIRHISFWFVVASLAAGLVLLHEIWADQLIRRLIDQHFSLFAPATPSRHYTVDLAGNVYIPDSDLNRSIAVVNMFLWPSILCALSHWRGWTFRLIATALIVSVALTTVGSNHETSKLAIIAGLVCFAFAYRWRNTARVLVCTVWTVLVLGCTVGAHLAYEPLGLHKAEWLQPTARQRIMIWNDVANRVSMAPLIGSGVRTGYVLSDRSKRNNTYLPVTMGGTTVARHAHNVYLQNWFELGISGAVLFLVAGLAALRSAGRLPAVAQPYALATFAVFMTEILSSWEIWQGWFAALFALTMIYLAIAIRSGDPPEVSAQPPP